MDTLTRRKPHLYQWKTGWYTIPPEPLSAYAGDIGQYQASGTLDRADILAQVLTQAKLGGWDIDDLPRPKLDQPTANGRYWIQLLLV